jgi:hypothetical protein
MNKLLRKLLSVQPLITGVLIGFIDYIYIQNHTILSYDRRFPTRIQTSLCPECKSGTLF